MNKRLPISDLILYLYLPTIPLLYLWFSGDRRFLLLTVCACAQILTVPYDFWFKKGLRYFVFLILFFSLTVIAFVFPVPDLRATGTSLVAFFTFSFTYSFGIRYFLEKTGRYDLFYKYILFLICCLGLWSIIYINAVSSAIAVDVDSSELVRRNTAELGFRTYLWIFQFSSAIIDSTFYTLIPISFLFLIPSIKLTRYTLLVLPFCIIAFYVNFTVLTRMPLVAGLPAAAIVACIIAYHQKEYRTKIALRNLVIVIVCVIGITLFLINNPYLEGLIARFLKSGEDIRWLLFQNASSLIVQYPLGHGVQHMQPMISAHNLFLDVGLSFGFFGIFVYSLFIFVLGYRGFVVLLKYSSKIDFSHYLMALFVLSNFFILMIDPPTLPRLMPLFIGLYYFSEEYYKIRGHSLSRLNQQKKVSEQPW